MKIIFLDFDGVLNTNQTIHDAHVNEDPRGWNVLDIECVSILNLLILFGEDDVRIVISSSWKTGRTLDELRDILVDFGFKYPERVIGKTPECEGPRCDEIQAWLDDAGDAEYKVEDFVVLDDEGSPRFMGDLIDDRLYLTDENVGLTHDIAVSIINRFGGL